MNEDIPHYDPIDESRRPTADDARGIVPGTRMLD